MARKNEIWLVYNGFGQFSGKAGDKFPNLRIVMPFSSREMAWKYIHDDYLTPLPFMASIEIDPIGSHNDGMVEFVNYRHVNISGEKIHWYVVVHPSKIDDFP